MRVYTYIYKYVCMYVVRPNCIKVQCNNCSVYICTYDIYDYILYERCMAQPGSARYLRWHCVLAAVRFVQMQVICVYAFFSRLFFFYYWCLMPDVIFLPFLFTTLSALMYVCVYVHKYILIYVYVCRNMSMCVLK